jgi:hypothetical protein
MRHPLDRCGTEALTESMCLLAMARLMLAPSGENGSYEGSPNSPQACHHPFCAMNCKHPRYGPIALEVKRSIAPGQYGSRCHCKIFELGAFVATRIRTLRFCANLFLKRESNYQPALLALAKFQLLDSSH